MVQDCLNGLFRPPWIQLGCKGNPCETDLILMRSIRHAAVHLPIGGKDLAEKRWTKNNCKVLHRHGVFGRLLVYPIEIVCQSGNENDPQPIPMQMTQKVLQCRVIGVRKLIHPLMQSNVFQSIIFYFCEFDEWGTVGSQSVYTNLRLL